MIDIPWMLIADVIVALQSAHGLQPAPAADPAAMPDHSRAAAARASREGAKRRAEDLPPPGCRTGHGIASLLPFLAITLASKPNPGPPGGIERRARPRAGAAVTPTRSR